MESFERLDVIFVPYEHQDEPGPKAGVLEIHKRLLHYLGLTDERCAVYRFFKYTDALAVNLLPSDDCSDFTRLRGLAAGPVSTAIAASRRFLYVAGSHHAVLPVAEAYQAAPGRALFLVLDSHVDISYSRLAGGPDGDCDDIGAFLSGLVRPRSNLDILHVGSKHVFHGPPVVDNVRFVLWQDLVLRGEDEVLADLRTTILDPGYSKIHIDIDLDVLGPGSMLAVSDPASLGLSLSFLLKIIACAAGRRELAGLSISGYNPLASPAPVYVETCLRIVENAIHLMLEGPGLFTQSRGDRR